MKKTLVGILAAITACTMLAAAAFAAPARADANTGGLIAGGQIFTGRTMELYNPQTGAKVTVQELNQGGWADNEKGVIYTQEAGGGDHFYGNDGTTLVTEWCYKNKPYNPDELIAGGQIFTGNQITVYELGNPAHGKKIQELNQGGYADPETGVIYQKGKDDLYKFYGNDGTTWVMEGYQNW